MLPESPRGVRDASEPDLKKPRLRCNHVHPMRKALWYVAAAPWVAALLTAVQVSAGAGRSFREAIPRPVLAAWICWLLWAPLVAALAGFYRRWLAPMNSAWRVTALVTGATIVLAASHATATASAGYLLAPLFGVDRPGMAGQILGLLPKSTFAAVLLSGATLAVEALSWRRLAERRALEAEAARLGAELEALRRQVAPHFLFNSLNALVVELRKGNSAGAEEGLLALSALLRRLLELGQRDTVPLEEELRFLESYLAIARIRYRDRLAFGVSADSKSLAAEVPPLIVQPLVENALQHGLSGRREQIRVEITARCSDTRVEILVVDDGAGLPPDFSLERDSRVGLATVADRVRLAPGGRGVLSLSRGAEGGTLAKIDLPLVRAGREKADHAA